MKFLVVDDNKDSLMLHVAMIRSMLPSSIIKSTENGNIALNYYIKDKDFDIIITNLNNSFLKGDKLVQEIKLINPNIVSICITSETKGTFNDENFNLTFQKPIHFDELKKNIINIYFKKLI